MSLKVERCTPTELYVAMCVILATFGVGMVHLAWYMVVELGMSQWSCHFTALMVLLSKSHVLGYPLV